MKLHVQAAGIAHGLAFCVAAPQCGGGGLAVGTGEAHSAGSGLQLQETNPSSPSKRQALLLLPHREGVLQGWASPKWVVGAGDHNPV